MGYDLVSALSTFSDLSISFFARNAETLSEDKAIRFPQQVPRLAVVAEVVPAGGSLGTERRSPAFCHLAHRQNIPGLFRNNIGHHKINFGFRVSNLHTARATTHTHLIQAVHQVGPGFYLHPPEVAPAIHNEVIAINVAPWLRHHEAETHRFVQKGDFAKKALMERSAASLRPLGGALLGRWNASARSPPGSAHLSGKMFLKGSFVKRKAQAGKLAPNLISASRLANPEGKPCHFFRL